jgi:hypothetical protein
MRSLVRIVVRRDHCSAGPVNSTNALPSSQCVSEILSLITLLLMPVRGLARAAGSEQSDPILCLSVRIPFMRTRGSGMGYERRPG